jgi:hypothetical protein
MQSPGPTLGTPPVAIEAASFCFEAIKSRGRLRRRKFVRSGSNVVLLMGTRRLGIPE